MSKFIIAGRFNSTDEYKITNEQNENLFYVDLLHENSFISGSIENLGSYGIHPNNLGLDLLFLAALVYAADTRIPRSKAQDSWTREIKLYVPVSNVNIWAGVDNLLSRTLNFLTGDKWEFAFSPVPAAYSHLIPRTFSPTKSFDYVGLFSGGLDSLIGSIDKLEDGNSLLLISHADKSGSKTQTDLYNKLKDRYGEENTGRYRFPLIYPHDVFGNLGGENTTRARSFLFIAAGIFALTGMPNDTLLVPENAFISLNVPLDMLRLGACSTRTTHPFYIARWNELLIKIKIGKRVINPYWNKTKGQMVRECKNIDFLKNLIPLSSSCSSPAKGRFSHNGIQNCGFCYPCLIRRAATLYGLGQNGDNTHYDLKDLANTTLNAKQAKGRQIRAIQYAIDQVNNQIYIPSLVIHKPGPLNDDPSKWNELAAVYQNGITELKTLLTNVRTISE